MFTILVDRIEHRYICHIAQSSLHKWHIDGRLHLIDTRHQVYFFFLWECVQFFISLPLVLLVTLRFLRCPANLAKHGTCLRSWRAEPTPSITSAIASSNDERSAAWLCFGI